MTIKFEIPSGNEHKILAAAIGAALVAYSKNVTVENGDIEAALAIEPLATEAPKSVETATAQESSTTRQSSESATASSQSSNTVKSNSAEAATDSTSSTVEQTQTQEQSNAGQGEDDVGDATVANDAIINGTRISSNDANKLDEKGVGFNEAFCGKAAKPFYSSGVTKGQWKRRQGVDQADYDAWYSESLAAVQQPDTGGTNVQSIDTAAAFQQNGEVINDGQNHQPQGAGNLTFDDAGAFMQWLSEQQAAELITAGDIDSAYQSTGNSMGDLFDPSKAADAIAQVYNFLSNITQGQQ